MFKVENIVGFITACKVSRCITKATFVGHKSVTVWDLFDWLKVRWGT